MLHTVNKSPFERKNLEHCLETAVEGDSILLFEDAVYAAMEGTAMAATMKAAQGKFKLYVLGNDLKARGMDESKVIGGISVVDYGGFVDLTVEANTVQAWL